MSAGERIDVHHHVAREYHPKLDFTHGADMTWWSLETAIRVRVMDENDIRKAILCLVPRLPKSKAVVDAMAKIRDGRMGRTKPFVRLYAAECGGVTKD
jgi:hypothetical protein